MPFSKELEKEITLAQLKKENQQLKKKLAKEIQIRRKTRKEPALDTKITTGSGLHHFYHKDVKNTGYEFHDLTYNSEKISFGKISSFWGSFEMYAYKNNEEHIYLALNGKVLQLDKIDLRRVLQATCGGANFLHVLGRKNGKKPKTVNH